MRLLVSLLALTTLSLLGCTPRAAAGLPDVVYGAYGERASLRPGETIAAPDRQGSLTFVEVSSDSRCPKGVTCIQAGEATVVVQLANGNRQEVAIGADYRTARRVVTGDIVVNIYGLSPYPQEGKTRKPEDYRLEVETSGLRD